MKKWLRRLLIVAMLAALILGGLYEHSTHVGRGWLFGEAHFEDRPTSYWRGRIDRWMDQHGDQTDLVYFMTWEALQGIQLAGHPEADVWVELMLWSSPEPTFWQRARGYLTGAPLDDRRPPKVLRGLAEAEPVLRELEADAKYRNLIEHARRQSEFRVQFRLHRSKSPQNERPHE